MGEHHANAAADRTQNPWNRMIIMYAHILTMCVNVLLCEAGASLECYILIYVDCLVNMPQTLLPTAC